MKSNYYQAMLLPIIFLFCSHATEPEKYTIDNDIKIELLKRIFQLEVSYNWKNEELAYYQRTGENLISWYTENEFY